MTPASIIPVFGSQRPYADLNFAGGSFGLDGRSVSDLTALPGFTFTRASLAMGYDATGKLTYGPNNLLLQSQTFDNAYWATSATSVTADAAVAPDGTTTADTLTENTANSPHTAQRTGVAIGIGGAGVLSIYAKNLTRRYINVRVNDNATNANAVSAVFDLQTGTITGAATAYGTFTSASGAISSVGNGWYRCSIGFVSSAATIGCKFELNNGSARTADGQSSYTGDGTSGIYIWGAQLEAVTYQTTPSTYYPTTTAAYYGPRLVYDPVTLASLGILVEEARTNLCLQSQVLGTTWTTNAASISPNTIASPDGTTNADSLIENTANAQHRVQQSITVTNATAYTYSIYAKANTRLGIYMRIITATTVASAAFNLQTGVINTTAVGAASIQNVGGGWYRCSVTGTTDSTSAIVYTNLQAAAGDPGIGTYTGDGTSGLYLWQGQLELGQGASSPIPTTTASVTRAADVAAVTGLALSYPMTVAVEAYRGLDKATDEFWVQVDAGASTDRVVLEINSVDRMEANMTSGGVGQGNSTVTATVPVGATAKAAARYAANSILVALGGVLGTEDTAATVPATPSNLRIGSNQSGQGQPMCTISRIRIYNRALSDAQLQSLTS